MTNQAQSTSSSACDTNAQVTSESELERLCKAVRAGNKAALFDALAQADIGIVIVEFGG